MRNGLFHKSGISIHAPREGGDVNKLAGFNTQKDFNPRPPRGGRRGLRDQQRLRLAISIHAPREGGDAKTDIVLETSTAISIHAPREGGDRH